MSPIELLTLYICFRLKHFAGDFLFQTQWMALNKGGKGALAYKALFSHALVHALGTLCVVLFFAPALWWLSVIDFIVHALIDRVKGVIGCKKGWKPKDTPFWWMFGVDQECHNFTHLAYIVLIFIHLGGVFS